MTNDEAQEQTDLIGPCGCHCSWNAHFRAVIHLPGKEHA